MTYWRLHYHLIWATLERQPALTAKCEKIFYGVLYGKAKELNLKVHAAGNVDDHVHIVVSIPPKLAVADCVRHIKGASAYAINHEPACGGVSNGKKGTVPLPWESVPWNQRQIMPLSKRNTIKTGR